MVTWKSVKLRLKFFLLVWRFRQLLAGFPAKGHLPRVWGQSRRSTNYKGDNKMIRGAVHRSPGMCLTTEENPEKTQLGDRRWRLCASNGFPYFQMRSAQNFRKREGRKKGKGVWVQILSHKEIFNFHSQEIIWNIAESKRVLWHLD